MSTSRSLPRNVSFYDATHLDVALGGFVQNGSITEGNFLDIHGMLLIIKEGHIRSREDVWPYRIQNWHASSNGSI